MSDIIVGLDIGTCFVRTVVAILAPTGKLSIAGVSKVTSQGLRNGVIVNIDAAAASIKNAIDLASQNSGYEISSCFVGIGGLNIESKQSNGDIGVSESGKLYHEVEQEDIKRVIEDAKLVRTNIESEILHVIPQYYEVDGVKVNKPLGMQTCRLGVSILIITGSSTQSQNIFTCLNRAQFEVQKILLKTLAQTQAVASPDELEAGSILIDLGGGTTDIIVFSHGAPISTLSVSLGGKDITSDIMQWKGISYAVAENIKIEHGFCYEDAIEYDEMVLFPSVGGKPPEEVPSKQLCFVIRSRMEEILTLAKQQIAKKLPPHTRFTGSIILTGGGALTRGIVELTQIVFGTSSVRLGTPLDFGGTQELYRHPDFATAVGLVVMGKDYSTQEITKHVSKKTKAKTSSSKDSALNKLKKFLAMD